MLFQIDIINFSIGKVFENHEQHACKGRRNSFIYFQLINKTIDEINRTNLYNIFQTYSIASN